MNKPELPFPIGFSTLHGNIFTTDQLEQYAKDYHNAMLGEPVAAISECLVNGQQTITEIDGRWRFLNYGQKLYAPKEES